MGKHDDLAARAHERIVLELRNRTMLQTLHALFGILVGTTMVLTGGPDPIENTFGPWARLILGGGLAIVGVVILIGSALTDNSWWGWAALAGGFVALTSWHSILCVSYAKAALSTPVLILGLGDSIVDGVGYRAYIPFVYFILACFALVQAVTLIRLGPPPR
jgi:hypothetical protein